jgi:hypothetical protein
MEAFMIPATRFKTKEKATIKINGRKNGITAVMGNISESGAGLIIIGGAYIPKKGEVVNLIVNLSTMQKAYHISAVVAWAKYMKMGVRFITKREIPITTI